MRKLITVRADENICGYTELTLPLLRKKASDWGADFKLLTGNERGLSGDHKFHFRILDIYDELASSSSYDVVLNLDADILITPRCPNPFEVLPCDQVSTIYEDIGTRADHRRAIIQTIQHRFGNVGWGSNYINTGFFMVGKNYREIFTLIKNDARDDNIWLDWGSDDVHLGYQINKMGVTVNQLSYIWNHMTMFSEAWNGFADRFQSNIIHYAGSGIFEKSRFKNKVDQIAADIEKLSQ